MSTVVKTNNLTKRFKNLTALNNVNLELDENKIYGLIGRNGAGKTTLLGIISGQNPGDSGNVEIMGEPVWENNKAIANICFSRELNPTTTFGPDNRKVKELFRLAKIFYPNWDEEFAQRLVKEFELDVKKRISKLSKGMLSMVSIIIGLASRAPITLLDEPVAGLDVVMRDKFYKILLEDYAENPRTFVISTHIIDEASGVFEETIMVDKGEIMLKENTDELISSYVVVSGREDVVSEATKGLTPVHTESVGKSLAVCVKATDNEKTKFASYDVDLSSVTLQKLFVYLTEKAEEVK